MKFKSMIAVLLAAVLLVAGTVGCSGGGSKGGGDSKVLNLGWNKDIQTMDVHRLRTTMLFH